MKKSVLVLAMVVMAFVSCKEDKKEKVAVKEDVKAEKIVPATGNVNVDNSTVTWKGSKPTGTHNGTVALKSGSIVVENGVVKSGEFVIDMKTITNLDMKGGGKRDLEVHLASADFFDVAKYPTAKFVVTKSEVKEGKLMVTGNLTIKDVTKLVTIPTKISEVGGVINFNSEVFKINRTDFNVKYKSKSIFKNLKDKFIYDDMEMSFQIMAKN